MASAPTFYTTASGNCQHLAGSPTRSPTRPPDRLNNRQVLAKLHALGVRFVRFSKDKIPFDPRHRTWGLSLAALLRTFDDPSLLIGWIPASVGVTVVDVDSGDWLSLVRLHDTAFHNASQTPGHRHLFYRDTEARADINGWAASGCTGDVRSSGPVILYDARRLLAALDLGLKGDKFPPATFKTHPPGHPAEGTETKVNSQQERSTAEGNPFPDHLSPWGGDKATVSPGFPLRAEESSQPQALFDRLRHWAYSHVADSGDYEGWAEAVQRQAEVLVTTVPDPENYSAAIVRTTARSVSGWTWERRDAFTGGHRDVDSAAQAWRARRRAESVWAAHAGRDTEIARLSLAGYSQRVIARSMGVSQPTVNRVLKRLSEAEDGAPELRMEAPEPVAEDPEPEEAEAEAEAVDMRPEEQEGEAVDMGPDTLGEASVETMGEARILAQDRGL